jgi:hypothetical protein
MPRRQRFHTVYCKKELKIHRLFWPEGSVIVKNSDTLGGWNEIG